MRILLMGNPNVGKSVVFNRLTGANVMVANYPGTTVEFTKGSMRLRGDRVEVVDVPGTYSLEPHSKAEEVASDMLAEAKEGDIVINVVDATNLERSLNLTLQVLKRRCPVVVALNLWDETAHVGVTIDVPALEAALGVPCVPTAAITGEGMVALMEATGEARVSTVEFEDNERWHEVGRIVEKVQVLVHRHHTFLEKLGDASVQPLSGFIIGTAVLVVTFEVVRFVGEGLIGYVFDPLFEGLWAPVMMKLSGTLGGSGFVHDLLVGSLVDGEIHFGESMGLLTTGIYVPFAAVLPYVFAFYVVLSFLEDCGFLPRMAVLADNLMHKIGLHGMGIVPMFLGLGCNVPGALSTRVMESDRDRFIAMTMMAVGVPCVAQLAMLMGIAGKHGAEALMPIFGTLFIVWALIGLILGKLIKGESTEILVDIPPYRIPYWRGMVKKILMRVIWFLREAVPWVLIGVLAVNLLYSLGIIGFIGKIAAPVVSGLLGLPSEAVVGMVVGFLRKDVAIGMLAPLNMTVKQIVIAGVVLSMYFPCAAAFAVMAKEMGPKKMAQSVAIMIISSLVVGGLLNLIL